MAVSPPKPYCHTNKRHMYDSQFLTSIASGSRNSRTTGILHATRHVYRSVRPAREAKPRFGATHAHDYETGLLAVSPGEQRRRVIFLLVTQLLPHVWTEGWNIPWRVCACDPSDIRTPTNQTVHTYISHVHKPNGTHLHQSCTQILRKSNEIDAIRSRRFWNAQVTDYKMTSAKVKCLLHLVFL